MLVKKKAVKEFLNRPLKDFRRWKKLSVRELDSRSVELPVRPPIWSGLRKHQKVCFLIGAKWRKFAYWLDTGTGKTLLSIALIKYFRHLDGVTPALVLVPNKINRDEWVREIEKHSPGTSFQILAGSSAEKWDQLLKSNDTILITTYAGMVRMACNLEEVVVKGKVQEHKKLKPSPKLIRKLQKAVAGLIMDESTAVQNRSSLAFRVCRQLTKEVSYTFALSGTPFGRDPTSLWSQMFLIDQGATLGPNLGIFRAAFFKSEKNFWSGFPEYTFDPKKEALLHRVIANRSIRYDADSSDLPRVVPITKEVKLPEDADAYYNKAKQRLIAAHGNYQEMKSAFTRMRQISSGWLGYKDDETGAKAQFEFDPNPKLELLISLVADIVETYKIVIYHEYIYSGHMICSQLKELKIDHARVYGGTKDHSVQLKKFTTDPKCRVFVINEAGAYGLNLQMAKYLIYFESPVSPVIRKQVDRRVERQESQHDKVFRYDLIVKNTYDEKILSYLKEGENLFKAVIKGEV